MSPADTLAPAAGMVIVVPPGSWTATPWSETAIAFTSMKFMVGDPMKPATNLFLGSMVEFERRADLLDAPLVERSAMVIASTWSCVT